MIELITAAAVEAATDDRDRELSVARPSRSVSAVRDANKWDEHCQASTIRNAILHDDYRHRVTGQVDVDLADKSVDIDLLNSVSSHLWMVTMSTRQEELVPTEEHYELIRGRIAAGDVGAR